MNKNRNDLLGRVLEIIETVFKTDSQFTTYCQIPHNFVTRAKTRGYLNPTTETLVSIKKGIYKKTGKHLNWEWLLEGKGSVYTLELNQKKDDGKNNIDVTDFSVSELIQMHPKLNHKFSLLMAQLEMTRDYVTNLLAHDQNKHNPRLPY